MKKFLLPFWLKVAMAVGIPALGVAAAVALFSDEKTVNQDEVHIIESIQEQTTQLGDYEHNATSQAALEQTSVSQPSGTTAVTQTAQAETVSEVPTNTTPTGAIPTEPAPTEPTSEIPTNPAPTEPVTEIPTKPVPQEPTTGATLSGSFEVKYTYDLLGRVMKAEYERYVLEYVYDGNGNILKINKILK